MLIGRPEDIAPETVVHRVGGGSVANLRLSPLDVKQTPPRHFRSLRWDATSSGVPDETCLSWLTKMVGNLAHGRNDDGGSVAGGGF